MNDPKYIDSETYGIDEMNKEFVALRKRGSLKLSKLQKLIKDEGLRSDDPIKDFAIVHFGKWDEGSLKPYRDLHEQLRSGRNKYVLVVKRRDEWEPMLKKKYAMNTGDADEKLGIMPPMEGRKILHITLDLQFGQIAENHGLGLDIQTGNIIIPTKNHLYSDHPKGLVSNPKLNLLKWEKAKGGIVNPFVDLPHLKSDMREVVPIIGLYDSPPRTTSKIIIHDKNIESFFSEYNNGSHNKGSKKYEDAKELLEEME